MSDTGKSLFEESKEYYSDPKNIQKKYYLQYGKLTKNNDYYIHKKCISELYNLVEVVADNKLDEFYANAERLPDEVIKGTVSNVYKYNGRTIFFWPTTTFAAKIFALRKIGYKIPDSINQVIRQIRNDTTHGNETIIQNRINLNYEFTKAIVLSFADCLISLGLLDESDREPDFEKLKICEGRALRDGEYVIGALLGEGGSSRVFKSTHKRLGTELAVKELNPDSYSESLIINESSILKKLRNNNIPRIFDVFSENGTYYIVMEFIDGVTLDRYLSSKKLSPSEKKSLALKICDIMIYLHEQETKIIFSDLKPQNIIVNKDNEPFLIDFGVAKIEGEKQEANYISEGYTAPEKYSCKDDIRADIYSYGVILRDIFADDAALKPIIDKCTCFNPDDRYPDFENVKNALNDIFLNSQKVFEGSKTRNIDNKENKENKGKSRYKWLIPVIAGAAGAVCAAIIIPLIVGTAHTNNADNAAASVQSEISSDDTEKGFQALSAFQNLFEQAFSYAKNDDLESYMKLFKIDESPDDKQAITDRIKIEYNTLRDHIKDSNISPEDYKYYYISSSDDCFAVGVLDTSVYDADIIDNYSYNLYTPISKTDDRWIFDYTLEAHNKIGQETADFWPPEILPFFEEADLQDNNYWVDIDDYSWMRSSVVIDDIVTAKISYMFQNDDGSILAGVNIKNGTDSEQTVSKLHLWANDVIMGKMFDTTVQGDVIPAHRSKTLLVTIPADLVSDSVKTQSWSVTEPPGADIL